jgi:hypothetical protein
MSGQYFVQIDDNNVAIRIAVVQREFLEANPERYTGRWVETFIDRPDKTYAGVGYTYDEGLDDFVAPVYEVQATDFEVTQP